MEGTAPLAIEGNSGVVDFGLNGSTASAEVGAWPEGTLTRQARRKQYEVEQR